MSLIALSISTAYIALTTVLAYFLRKIIAKTNLPAKDLFYEAVAAAELCAACFELIIVADNFGVATYAIYLFFLTIWWSYNWEDASACPYTHMEDLCEGNCSVKDVALKTWAALMGGCCVFRYVQLYWWLEVTENHQDRAFEDCSADLKVDPYVGAVIEGVATLLCRIASKSIAELNPRFGTIIDSFIGTSLVVMAFNYSGGYFNPVLATALKWGCDGHTNMEHVIVYWIGSCTGALLSVPIFKMIRQRGYLSLDVKTKEE
uniref:CSON001276 protein n=1 Tax=Culicoides sonorensis TaxID=179676 RepID=A0A336MNQ0_CULSO